MAAAALRLCLGEKNRIYRQGITTIRVAFFALTLYCVYLKIKIYILLILNYVLLYFIYFIKHERGKGSYTYTTTPLLFLGNEKLPRARMRQKHFDYGILLLFSF